MTPSTTPNAQVAPVFAPFRYTGETFLAGERLLDTPTPRSLFGRHRAAMTARVQQETRPGLFLFAAHLRAGVLGHLWLEGGDSVRTAILGRHDDADLALPLDETLSLRHVLFALRGGPQGLRFLALDLGSENGLRGISGEPLHAAEFDGPAVVTAGDFVVFCLPSGPNPEWIARGRKAWRLLQRTRPVRVLAAPVDEPGDVVASIDCAYRGAGMYDIVDEDNLRRGLLIGRSDRCDVIADLPFISRVHAVIVEFDGAPWLFDLASRNGTTLDGVPVTACRLETGQRYLLGGGVKLRWRAGADPLGPKPHLPN